jgi:hypothetical protein
MVSKYFNYVLVLAMLIGVSAPLPQVKNQLTSLLDSTTISSNSALAFGSVTSSPLQNQCSTPEQVINILARAGIIPTSKVNDAFRIVKSLPGSDGSPVPVPENKGTASSTASTTSPRAGVVVSNWVINKGYVSTPTSGVWSAAYPTISFTIINLGNEPLYISKSPTTTLSLSVSSGNRSQVSVSSFLAGGSTSGDTSTSYIVNGTRTFTANLYVDNTGGTTASKRINVTQINYGTAGVPGSDNTLSIRDRLENAFVIVP